MTGHAAPLTASDAALIAQARLGDDAAFATLAERHRPALTDLARLLADDPDDLVARTLEAAHTALRRSQGPQVWLRGYLLRLARRESTQLVLPAQRRTGSAFCGLAEAWQAVLWHGIVERDSTEEVAAVVGVAAAGVQPLVASAQEELRRALLSHRWAQPLSAACRAQLRRLPATRAGAPPRAVLRHATACPGCARLVDQLDAVEHHLPEALARHTLGPLGGAYLGLRVSASALLGARSGIH